MHALQIAAYASSLALAGCAARVPRIPAYALARLGLDLLRLALEEVPGAAPLLYGLDAFLSMTGPAALAYALRLPWHPVAGLAGLVGGLSASEVAGARGEALAALYGAGMLSAHVFIVGCAVADRSWRSRVDLSGVVLLALAAVGVTGAVLALAWPDRYEAVNLGNVIARLVLCGVCLGAQRLQK